MRRRRFPLAGVLLFLLKLIVHQKISNRKPMKTTTYLLAFLVAFIFSSCGMFKDVSIEKRHYRNGYYVQKRGDRVTEKTVVKENVEATENAVVAKTAEENNTSVGENSTQPTPAPATANSFTKEKSKKHFSAPALFKKGKDFVNKTIPAVSPKPATPATAHDEEAAVALVLLIILAIILPPLAVLLADGFGIHFLVDLIFWLLGFGFVIFITSGGVIYLGIFGLIAIIYALFVVFDVI
jgi:uncharacterized membrane protein YqaE (UPF0057 family)